VSLASLWSLTEGQSEGWPASRTLAAAEHVAAQLLGAGYVDLYRRAHGGERELVPDEQRESVLRARQSWTVTGESTVQLIARTGEADMHGQSGP